MAFSDEKCRFYYYCQFLILFFNWHFVQKNYNKLYKNYKGAINMLAVSFSTMRNNLKSYCDKAVKENSVAKYMSIP